MLIMRLEGRNLRDEIHEAGWRPDLPTALRIARQLAQAGAYMHSKGTQCCCSLAPQPVLYLGRQHQTCRVFKQLERQKTGGREPSMHKSGRGDMQVWCTGTSSPQTCCWMPRGTQS